MGNLLDDWAFLSDADKRKIEKTLGITLADYATSEEREAVLIEFELETRRQAEIRGKKEVIDYFFERQESVARVLPVQPTPRYLPPVEVLPMPQHSEVPAMEVFSAPPGSSVSTPVMRPQPAPRPALQYKDIERTVVSEERDTPKPETTSPSFFNSVRQYAMVTALTVGGAYLGFSAARHTDLADELRRMEEKPIIRAYQVAHEVEVYQGLREFDFLGPERERITERRELLNSAKKKIGKVARVIDTLKTLVEDIPLLGRGAALIEQQQEQIQIYKQKEEQYTSNLITYTTVGAGGGFGLGVFLAFKRRRKA